MNNLGPQSDLLDELFAGLFDGGLDETRAAQLAELLAADRAARQRYVRYVALHAMLQWRSGTLEVSTDGAPAESGTRLDDAGQLPVIDEATPHETAPREMAGPRSTGAIVPMNRESRIRRLVTWHRGLAASVLLLLGAWLTVYSLSHHNSGPATAAVATVISSSSPLWDDPSPPTSGTGLARGRQLSLSAGSVEIRFDGGARVIVQGPARFSIDSPGALTLFTGKVSAIVPVPARGFVVNTPGAIVTDLGTEFGVSVDAAGATDVEVFKGRVEAVSRTGNAAHTTLAAGDAARISGGTISPLAAGAPSRQFVRHLGGGASPAARPGAAAGTIEVKLGTAIERTLEQVKADNYACGPKQQYDAASGETHVYLPYGTNAESYDGVRGFLADPKPGSPAQFASRDGFDNATLTFKLHFDQRIGTFRFWAGWSEIGLARNTVAGVEYSEDGKKWKTIRQIKGSEKALGVVEPLVKDFKAAGLNSDTLYIRLYTRDPQAPLASGTGRWLKLRTSGDPSWGDAATSFFSSQLQVWATPVKPPTLPR